MTNALRDNIIAFPKRPTALRDQEYLVERQAEYEVALLPLPEPVEAVVAEVRDIVDITPRPTGKTRFVLTERGRDVLAYGVGVPSFIAFLWVGSKVAWVLYFAHFGG